MPSPIVRIYVFSGCDTCRKALQFLKVRRIVHDAVPIRGQPPTVPELRQMREWTGSLKRLFNSSGMDYRAMNLAARLPGMTEAEAFELLATHGNLVKRPFFLTGDGRGTTGFNEKAWSELLS